MNDKTRVFNCDCLPAMRETPDKFYELAIVDPVFGHDIKGGHKSENGWRSKTFWGKASEEWNTIKTQPEYFVELLRVSKNAIVWGGNYFQLPPSEGWVVWDKGQRDFSLADAELAWTSFERATRVFDYARSLSNFRDGERIHPTQKPVALYKWLLKNYAKEGDKILDTHGGSMSSVIACLEMGFEITCYEKDPDYYQAAKKRIEQYLSQQKIFDTHGQVEFIQ